MIKKLKVRFITLSMSSLFVLLTVIVAGMNVINYRSVVDESDEILSVLSQNQGIFPEFSTRPGNKFFHKFSPETPYESRYFSVTFNSSGDIIGIDTNKIASVDENAAIEYSFKAIKKEKIHGFIGNYRYVINGEFNTVRITFLDSGRKLDSFKSFLSASVWMSLIGFSIVFIVIFVLSGKIIKPIVESHEKQKRFITDAGHEIKTPLTIINANVDLLEMDLGEDNECLHDIHEQTDRLKNLTEDLVMLSRMEEAEKSIPKIDFPISEIVEEASKPFSNLALSQNKEFVCNITPMLSFCGNEKAISQLIYILLDNALKYSSDEGTITLSLSKKGRNIILSVANSIDMQITNEQLKHIFDRFYRTDSSRNSETGGHGIGLSVAKAIVSAHGGEISASGVENQFQITASLPC